MHSTTHVSSSFTPVKDDQRNPIKEQISILDTKVMKLDSQITQSLEKITELEIFQSNDQTNPHKNQAEIDTERVCIEKYEQDLSGALQQRENLSTKLSVFNGDLPEQD